MVIKAGAPQVAMQAMARHTDAKELCTFHCVFMFFIAEDLMAALAKGSVVTVDLCCHVRRPVVHVPSTVVSQLQWRELVVLLNRAHCSRTSLCFVPHFWSSLAHLDFLSCSAFLGRLCRR